MPYSRFSSCFGQRLLIILISLRPKGLLLSMLHLKRERERGRKVRWERAGERERGGGRVEWGRREKGERERSRRSVDDEKCG